MTLQYAILMVLAPVFAAAQTAAAPVVQAFDHYEGIRVVLAEDKIETVSTHAKALAPLAGQLAGKDARAAAERMAAAKTLDSAREQFALLSSALVPKFLDARLPGVHAFMCPMKNASWAQRTDKLENPYYGQAMLTCGSEIKATR
jgi:Cu(I)/Ag(I) efflux system membrane fusion protein